MGCACLRGDGHPWAVRGAGRVVARGRQQDGLAHQPDLAGAHARSQLLRRGGDADALRLSDGEAQPDADTIAIGQPIGDRDRQRLGDALPIADRHAVSVGER